MPPLPLSPSLDASAALPLHQELVARLDTRQPMLMDGSEVVRVGQACLQVLVAARAAAATQQLAFAIADPSAALADMAALARLDVVLEPLG